MDGLLLPGLLVAQVLTLLALPAAFWSLRDFIAWRRLR